MLPPAAHKSRNLGYLGVQKKSYWGYYNILGLYRDNGKENGNYRGYRDYIGIINWCHMGIMGKKMETTVVGFRV